MKRLSNRILTFLLVFAFALALPVTSFAANTSVRVTVEVLWSSVSAKVDSATYYVTVYKDTACTNVKETKSVTLRDASSGSVTFSNLDANTTYYIAASDSNGKLKVDTSSLTISYPSGNSVYVSSNDTSTKDLKIQYNYSKDPNTASAKTADESQPLLFGGIAVLCVLVGGAVVLMKKKQNA